MHGPLKPYWCQAIEKWPRSHPGRAVTEYKISQLLGESFSEAFTPANIASGFSKPSIFPFNNDVWLESDFLPAQQNTSVAPPTPAEQSIACEDDLPETGGVKGCLPCQFQNLFKSLHVQLEDIAPLPKRKAANWKGGRKPVQSKILTSTVVKDAIHTAESERRQKKKGRSKN